ncbi:MAG: lactate permease LctP family transporter [Chitinophagaceae bacterium]|nr:lactate permease LctP family transporter [Chitinophagaceae bacterium]
MSWTQLTNPLHHIGLSALLAALPLAFIFWALIIQKMKGHTVCLLTVLAGMIIATAAYGMPVKLAVLSAIDGALFGLFTICWIIMGVLFLYHLTVESGQFAVIRNFMAAITTDRRLQALLIAFAFGSFLEGAAGFGAPVAITASMLAGLGFDPLYAAGICLIANTAPVAFGSIGIPITVASQVSGLPEMAISQMVGKTLPLLSLVLPFYLVFITVGYHGKGREKLKKTWEIWPAILVAGASFAIVQFVTANFISPMLPDVLSGLTTIIALIILLKYWKPDKNPLPPSSTVSPSASPSTPQYTSGQIARAWSPFMIMTLLVILWGIPVIKDQLNAIGQFKAFIPGLQHAILQTDGTPLPVKPFTFNWLSNAGTAILLAALLSMPLIGANGAMAARAFRLTLRQLKFPAITIASVMGFAYVVNNSGMSITMALALAATGALFPFFSPVLGWLGVFLTGSDTSSNALFCKLQYNSAVAIGVDPVVTVAANVSGGVTGKMISPQSIAIGATAVDLVGKEADLFRFTAKHSFIMLLIVCILTTLQAYVVHLLNIFGL